jgi:hypothetical protein
MRDPPVESGRGHLRHGRHNFDAADGSPCEFADVALGSAGTFYWDLLHSGRFAEARLRGGFSGQANSSMAWLSTFSLAKLARSLAFR